MHAMYAFSCECHNVLLGKKKIISNKQTNGKIFSKVGKYRGHKQKKFN